MRKARDAHHGRRAQRFGPLARKGVWARRRRGGVSGRRRLSCKNVLKSSSGNPLKISSAAQ